MVGLFRKCQLFAFYMGWIYLIFHGVISQCVLFMMAVEYFMDASFCVVYGNFQNLNMMFHPVYLHATLFWILCNFSWKASSQFIMTKGLHFIPIDFITCCLKSVSKIFLIFLNEESWWYVVVISENIIFKMSVLCCNCCN